MLDLKNEYPKLQGMSCFPRQGVMPRGFRNWIYGEAFENGRDSEMDLAVYGAGMVAVSVYYAIKNLYKNCRILCFIVKEKAGNPEEIDHVPVVSIDEFGRQDVKIVVATPENHHQIITAELEKRNLKNYFCMDSRREAALMEQYYRAIKQFPSIRAYHQERETKGRERRKISFHVYMTRFHKDMPLKNPYKVPEWLSPIQAGAALTELSVADIKDNTGDTISEKNGNYSELTALYWIWKNKGNEESGSDYLGLFHYRRILDVGEEELYQIGEHEMDVVLPYPTIHYPSIDEHHRRYVKDRDWKAMASALQELAPKYAQRMPEIFAQPYFYNYNIFIARRQIFCEFCNWLFPILKRTEELSIPKGWERADRYIGYLGENLTTLYFMYHKDDFKTAHTGRLMLI